MRSTSRGEFPSHPRYRAGGGKAWKTRAWGGGPGSFRGEAPLNRYTAFVRQNQQFYLSNIIKISKYFLMILFRSIICSASEFVEFSRCDTNHKQMRRKTASVQVSNNYWHVEMTQLSPSCRTCACLVIQCYFAAVVSFQS